MSTDKNMFKYAFEDEGIAQHAERMKNKNILQQE